MNPEVHSGEEIPFYPDDTLEDLQRCGFRMLQKKQGFRFGLDSVLLAAYAASFYSRTPGRAMRVADLGAGCGAVSLLLAARLPGAFLAGLELDRTSCETLERNSRLNNLPGRLQAVCGDICRLADGTFTDEFLQPGSFDLVVSNPPYRRPGQSWPYPVGQAAPTRQQAREETAVSLDALIAAAARLLRPKGRLVLVHQVQRLPEIIGSLHRNRLEPKTMRLIQSLPDRPPVTLLLSAVLQGRPGGFQTGLPLLVCSAPGVLSPETASLYGRENPMSGDELLRGLRPAALPAYPV